MKYKRGATALSGVLLLDKALGWTSHDIVNKLRHLSKEGRIGHCGTLDPHASGLMIMLVGHAAKLQNDFLLEDKRYTARITFGSATTTDDAQGETTEKSPIPAEVFTEDYARKLLKTFLGEQDQVPPDFSALKQEGRVAHREARKGKPLVFEPRRIKVRRADLMSINEAARSWLVDFDVSKGTYIRALARDIGRAAGTHAHLSDLRRLASGDFSLKDAYTIEEVEAKLETAGPLGLADLFLTRETLLKSVSAERLIATSVAGRRIGPSVVTIGVFDGVHAGHQALLTQVVQRAKKRGLLSTVLTFDVHPQGIVRPFETPKPLMSFEDKVAAIKACGIDQVIVLPFNHKMSQQSAEDFLLATLPSLVKVQEIIVGENFRCGKGAQCSPADMQKIYSTVEEAARIPVIVVDL